MSAACVAGRPLRLALAGLAACAGAKAPSRSIRSASSSSTTSTSPTPWPTAAAGWPGWPRCGPASGRPGPMLFVLAGDVLSPSLLSKYYGGRQMVEALNAAKLDYATFGNHEFELPARHPDGPDRRIQVQVALQPTAPWPTARRSPRSCPGIRSGCRATWSASSGSPCRAATGRYVRCADPDSAAHRAIDTLVAQGADLIVGLTHQTIEADRDLLAREPRLDLILGGHEHEAHDSVVSGRHVLKADANSRERQFVTLWGGKGEWRQAVGLVQIDSRLPDDTAVAAGRRARGTTASGPGSGPSGRSARTSVPIDARDAVSRRRESVLGDLVTDAVRRGHRSRRRPHQRRRHAAGRRDPAGAGHQLPAGVDLPLRRRDPDGALPADRRPAAGVAGARRGRRPRWARAGSSRCRACAFTYDPGRRRGSRIQGDLRRASGGGDASRRTRSGGIPVYPAARAATGTRFPRPRPPAPRATRLPGRRTC